MAVYRKTPILIVLFMMMISPLVQAQIEHQLVRRAVVFPIRAERQFEEVAEEAWWQAREALTESRRFLVASKQFLVKQDVFQPRGLLEPADSIILGKLLDAHMLLTLQLQTESQRLLSLNAYDGGNGLQLWSKSVPLHPSRTVAEQLPSMARKLVNDFVASIPYHGFTIVDSLIGHAVYEEGDIKLAQADLGVQSRAQIGDLVQWVKIINVSTAPVFQGGAKIQIFAEGKIVRLEQGIATLEISRATSLNEIKEYTLVRVPREAERLSAEFAIHEVTRATLTSELVSPEASPMEQVARERRPLVAALNFVASVAAYLLLAF